MKQDILLLMAVVSLALALAVAAAAGDAADAGQRRSRFLLQSKKCSFDLECVYPGSPGPSCCSGSCVDTTSSVYNCGKCGKNCKFTQECCGGKCVDLMFDKKNCGFCYNKCKKNCVFGLCDYV